MSRQVDVMLEISVDWQPFINAMQELSDAVAVMWGVPTSAERARQREFEHRYARQREFERRYARQRMRKARRVRQGR